ncbi:hypothetical protein, partial [uncultured Bilophila sp.]|uniref:hypothetical protein n=1 Tax=uncultured Bilophila sp. TaxID=529385 RepID=UPI0026493ACF
PSKPPPPPSKTFVLIESLFPVFLEEKNSVPLPDQKEKKEEREEREREREKKKEHHTLFPPLNKKPPSHTKKGAFFHPNP